MTRRSGKGTRRKVMRKEGAFVRSLACVFAVGCGALEIGEAHDTRADDDRPTMTGDQSAFADIAVGVSVSEFDVEQDADEAPPSNGTELRMQINGGAWESRVPGLGVFADGVELREVGAATYPQVFSFLSSARDRERGAPARFELRYQGSTFSFTVLPLSVEFERPKWNEEVPSNESLMATWSGFDRAPVDFHTVVSSPCEVAFGAADVGKTSVVLEPRAGEGGPLPCNITLEARWVLSELNPESPFRSLTVRREAIRRQRIVLR